MTCSWATFNLIDETCHRCSLEEGHDGEHDCSVLVPGVPKPSIAAFVFHSALMSEESYEAFVERLGICPDPHCQAPLRADGKRPNHVVGCRENL